MKLDIGRLNVGKTEHLHQGRPGSSIAQIGMDAMYDSSGQHPTALILIARIITVHASWHKQSQWQ